MSVAKVQVAHNGSASSDTTTVTLSSGPTVGNYMIAWVMFFPDPLFAAIPPSGWTTVGITQVSALYLGIYSRVVQGGDGTGYTWNFTYNGSPNAQNNQIILYELSGQDTTTPINNSSTQGFSSSTTPALSFPPTPSVDACYPISILATGGFQTTSVASSDGTTFTKDVDQGAGSGDMGSAIGTLTSGTSTAVNCHWAIDVALSGAVGVYLIAPAVTGRTYLLT